MLLILFQSCKTLPITDANDLYWTPVPAPEDSDGNIAVEYNTELKKVMLEEWYWFAILNYIIDTEANIKLLTEKR